MTEKKHDAVLALRVHPGARRNAIRSITADLIDLKVAAPADKGKANAELVSFLAASLGVARNDVRIIRGDYSHSKLISVSGLAREEALARLSVLAERGKSGEQKRLQLS